MEEKRSLDNGIAEIGDDDLGARLAILAAMGNHDAIGPYGCANRTPLICLTKKWA